MFICFVVEAAFIEAYQKQLNTYLYKGLKLLSWGLILDKLTQMLLMSRMWLCLRHNLTERTLESLNIFFFSPRFTDEFQMKGVHAHTLYDFTQLVVSILLTEYI